MTKAATLLNPEAPAFARARALIALILQLLFRPDAAAQIDAMLEEAEAQAARALLEHAIRMHGDPALSADDFDVRLIWRGARLDFAVLRRASADCGALHPMHAIILAQRHARRAARLQCARARRRRMNLKLSSLYARIIRRRACRASVQHRDHTRIPIKAALTRPALPP